MQYIDSSTFLKINKKVKSVSRKLGGEHVLIHSDIKNLFLFKFKSKIDLLEKHMNNINNIFSEFNIWMPTFNYDFTKTGLYNVNEDICQVGHLNNYFRKFCHWRTTTPVFNFSGMGKYPIENIKSGLVINPFSFGSEFHYLYENKSVYCHYGSDISLTSILHYVENITKKDLYRYSKKFYGIVKNNSLETNVILDYQVSPLKKRIKYDWKKIHLDLLNENLLYEYKIFTDVNYITLFSVRKVCDYWTNRLNEDPYYFLAKESKKWVRKKIDALGRGFELNDFE